MIEELNEIMQVSIIEENIFLSEIIGDIKPKNNNVQLICNKEVKEIKKEKTTNNEFRIVVYKKQNPILSFFKNIKFIFKKLKIMRNLGEIDLAKHK